MGSLARMALWGSEFAVVAMLLLSALTCADESLRAYSVTNVCPIHSLTDSIIGFRDWRACLNIDTHNSIHCIGVIEGDEVSLQKALNMVQKNHHEYVAILFYASWCPFSQIFRPSLSNLSSLFPSIHHFAIEESAIRPSILSKYGVHGFPILFILNATMRISYHGPRTLGSLIAFYSDVTGIRTVSLDQLSLDKVERLSVHEKHVNTESESCPFSWARSPENLLRQMYLTLATAFVLLRLLNFFFPTLLICIQCPWRRLVQSVRLWNLLEHPLIYLKQIMQSLCCLKEPCKRSNLPEGAMNAKAWASKSLATVSIGEGSTNWGMYQYADRAI